MVSDDEDPAVWEGGDEGRHAATTTYAANRGQAAHIQGRSYDSRDPGGGSEDKRRGPTVSVDTTTASTEIETMVVEEDDSTSPDSPALKVVETPRKAADEEGAAKHSAGKTG